MRKTSRTVLVAVSLVTLAVLTVVASATAATVTDKQVTPGMHQRTIWDKTQVTVLALPNVNHYGNIHMELYFKNYAADLDLYLLNQDGEVVSDTGALGDWLGWEAVDFKVTEILNYPWYFGDRYYLAVVAFNGASDYFIWGYYPESAGGTYTDPADPDTYSLEIYNYPQDRDWAGITGPRVGGAYDFRATSMGTGSLRLEWPVDVTNLVVKPDLSQGLMPAWFQQYLYTGTYWQKVVENEGTWAPPVNEGDPLDPLDDWYGLYDMFKVPKWSEVVAPQKVLHYVPSLYMAYQDPLIGPDGYPRTGRTTMGYRAILTWPENLWLKKVVKYDEYYKVYGAYSLNGERVAAGHRIDIERRTATSGWRVVKTVYTTALGTWSVKIVPGLTWTIRAKASGDISTGISPEYSISKVLKPL